jgi:hypothetical protein
MAAQLNIVKKQPIKKVYGIFIKIFFTFLCCLYLCNG